MGDRDALPQTGLTGDLLQLSLAWRELKGNREAQDRFYADRFSPVFMPQFSGLPLAGAQGGGRRPSVLISIAGMSWQAPALMAAWTGAQRVFLVGTEESLKPPAGFGGETYTSLLARVSGRPESAFCPRAVAEGDEVGIYRAVRECLEASPGETVWVDVTGGKKSMSAAAALAGFVRGLPLVYVDYGEYEGRIPVAGTEYPRLLANPLEVLGELETGRIRDSLGRGEYAAARALAELLRLRLDSPETRLLAEISAGYDEWERFNFGAARRFLDAAWQTARTDAETAALAESLGENLAALDARAANEGFWHVLNLRAHASRALARGDAHRAVMATNAAAESFLKHALHRDFPGRQDPRAEVIFAELAEQKDLERTGRILWGPGYRRPQGRGYLTFMNSFQVYSALRRLDDKTIQGWSPRLHQLAQTRNSLPWAHGQAGAPAPRPEDAAKHLETLDDLMEAFADEADRATKAVAGKGMEFTAANAV